MDTTREQELIARIEQLERKLDATPLPEPKPDADEEAQKRALYRIKNRRNRYDK